MAGEAVAWRRRAQRAPSWQPPQPQVVPYRLRTGDQQSVPTNRTYPRRTGCLWNLQRSLAQRSGRPAGRRRPRLPKAVTTSYPLNGIVSRIRDRRFVAADTERGIVFAFAFFDHHRINWTGQIAELFKIEKGMSRRVEAVFHQAPFGIPSGWSTYEQSISEEIQSVR
jgi:hypothetical protein